MTHLTRGNESFQMTHFSDNSMGKWEYKENAA